MDDTPKKRGSHGGKRPGAGRPAIGPEVKIDLPPEIVSLYDAAAQEAGSTRAALMRAVLVKHAPGA